MYLDTKKKIPTGNEYYIKITSHGGEEC